MALLIADLSLLSATRDLASLILADYEKIHVLVNNAGVFESKPALTSEGRDRVLATNLLSPFVLAGALLPVLRRGAPSRVVNIGSSTSDRASLDPDHLVLGNRWGMQRAYSQSKLALMMTTFALAKRATSSSLPTVIVRGSFNFPSPRKSLAPVASIAAAGRLSSRLRAIHNTRVETLGKSTLHSTRDAARTRARSAPATPPPRQSTSNSIPRRMLYGRVGRPLDFGIGPSIWTEIDTLV